MSARVPPGPSLVEDVEELVRWAHRHEGAQMFGVGVALDAERAAPLDQFVVMTPQKAVQRAGKPDAAKADDAALARWRREVEAGVRDLLANALSWARKEQRPQRFSLTAHETQDPGSRVISARTFNVIPSGELASEDPEDARDQIAQLQRMVKDAISWGATNIQQCMDAVTSDNAELRRHVRSLDGLTFELLKQREQLLDDRASRDVRAEDARLKVALKREGAGVLMRFVNEQLLAGKAPKGEVRAEDVARLFGTMTPEQRALASPLLSAIWQGMSEAERRELARIRSEAPAAPAVTVAPAPATPVLDPAPPEAA